jgi:hypothetical protein
MLEPPEQTIAVVATDVGHDVAGFVSRQIVREVIPRRSRSGKRRVM